MRGRYEGAARWRVYCTLQQLQHMGYGSLYLAQTHKVLRGWCNAAMSAFLWKLRSMHHVGLGALVEAVNISGHGWMMKRR